MPEKGSVQSIQVFFQVWTAKILDLMTCGRNGRTLLLPFNWLLLEE